MIRAKGHLVGSLNVTERPVYPELENLDVIPTEEQQVFSHQDSYGYNKVTVEPIPDNYIVPNGVINITENGNVNVSAFESAEVNVYISPVLQDKEVTPTKDSQNILYDEGFDGLNQVTVNPIPDEYIIPAGVIDITDNGDIDVTNYKTAKVDVHIPPVLQDKNVTPNKEIQEVIFDEGYEGLSKVTVNPIPDEYVIPNLGTKSINVNGIYNAIDDGFVGYSSVEVATSGDPELEDSYKSLIDISSGSRIVKLPSGLTKIGENAFYQRRYLKTLILPDEIDYIGQSAFSGCSALTLDKLPSGGLTQISAYCFQNCTNLNLPSLPEGITRIYQYAFANCTNLALTSLPESVNTIDGNAFQKCTNLALTSLPSNLTNIQSYTFEQCTNLALTSLPESITSIGSYAFYKCSNITISKYPDSFTGTSAGSYTFAECPKITISSLPASVTTIQNNAFYRCSGLTEMTINGKVTSISNSAFGECTSLAKLVLPNVTAVPTLSSTNALANTRIASKTGYIYVPDDLVSSFKSKTNWSTYANQIKGLSEMEG